MRIISLDAETLFCSKSGYTLKKLTTEEYLRHPRFKVHCWGSYDPQTDDIWNGWGDWAGTAILNHHSNFDGGILQWHEGVRPAFYLDTLSMARLVMPRAKSHSLGALAAHFGLPEKTVPYNEFDGVENPGPLLMARLRDGANHDAWLTYQIFLRLLPHVPRDELRVIDSTIRLFTEPVLRLDVRRCAAFVVAERQKKSALLAAAETNADAMQSADKFKLAIEALGYDCPMKWMPPTKTNLEGREIPALAKTDEAMTALLEHEDERVQALAMARLGVKSTLGETRGMRMLQTFGRGPLPVYQKYWGAHTGRTAAGDGSNYSNLPRLDREGGELRLSILSPEDSVLVIGDLAQIELRVNACLAGEQWVLDALAEGRDIYSEVASEHFGYPVSKATLRERQFGKSMVLGCFGADTIVLTHVGPKAITDVTIEDKLWDGEQWVNHCGLLDQGERTVISLAGLSVTPDHLILCGKNFLPARQVLKENILCLALATGLESFPLPDFLLPRAGDWLEYLCGALAARPNTPSIRTLSLGVRASVVMYALKKALHERGKNIGATPISAQTTKKERDSSIGLPQSTLGLTPLQGTNLTGYEGYIYATNGALTGENFSPTSSVYQEPTIPKKKLTVSTIIKATRRVIYGLLRGQKTMQTGGLSSNSNRKIKCYDLSYAGPLNRYTVVTDAGPLIVHNCGFGMGPTRFRQYCRENGFDLTEQECERAIKGVYRPMHGNIVKLWNKCGDQVLPLLHQNATVVWQQGPVHLEIRGQKIYGPNGTALDYGGLHKDENGDWRLLTRRGRIFLHGPKICENVVQWLARCIMWQAHLRIINRTPYAKLCLTSYDELVYSVPKEFGLDTKIIVDEELCRVPDWMPGIPLAAEVHISDKYDK